MEDAKVALRRAPSTSGQEPAGEMRFTVAVSLSYLAGNQVRVIALEGAVHPSVEIEGDRCVLSAQFKRVFPLSRPDEFISIQDPTDHEVGILESLEGMADAQRAIVMSE